MTARIISTPDAPSSPIRTRVAGCLPPRRAPLAERACEAVHKHRSHYLARGELRASSTRPARALPSNAERSCQDGAGMIADAGQVVQTAWWGPALAFAAGLVSFASPCVLPLVPGYLAFVTGGQPVE